MGGNTSFNTSCNTSLSPSSNLSTYSSVDISVDDMKHRKSALIQFNLTPPGQEKDAADSNLKAKKKHTRKGSNLAHSVSCDWSKREITKERMGMQRRLDYLKKLHQRSMESVVDFEPGQLHETHVSFAS